ncbi:MAG: NAD(P)H-dependent glycerol-3-phosphate dehydrogenase [bacterium]
MNFAVLGSGRLGTSLAKFLGEREEVYLWGRDEALIKRIQVDRTNDFYLPNVKLPTKVRASYDLDHVLSDSDVVLLAVPSHAYVEVLDECVDYLGDMEAVICGTTGFDPETSRLLSQEYLERLESLNNYFILSGPAPPHELADQQLSNMVLTGRNEHNRQRLAELLYRNYLRVYEHDDIKGTEITTAVNNLLALVGGLVEGLGLHSGTRGALLNRGIFEAKELVRNEDGEPETVFTLCGLGTALSIGTSTTSRNYRLGVALGKGKPLEQARSSINGCLEAIPISRCVHKRILKGEIKAPLLTEIYGIIHETIDPYNSLEKIINLKYPPGEA